MKGSRVRGMLWGVIVVSAALYLLRLGQAPLVDPPEGFHLAIAHEMAAGGDWITPHFNGVRYFDKPPLLYWLMAIGLKLLGATAWAARLWSALAAIATAFLTAWLGRRLGSDRLGLIAGLVVATNLEFFIFGRFVKPDLLFVFLILLAYVGFILAYRKTAPWALLVCYAGLGGAALTKDLFGIAGPLVVFALFFLLTRERHIVARWVPLTGLALLALVLLPWYLVMEWKNPGFLWYTIVDNHLLNLARHRIFPDEDVPLTAAEFLGVTAMGFFPWSLALPWGLVRAFRRPWQSVEARIWLLLGLWTAVLLAFFTVSPFRLPHYGLPAFPAMALLVAKVWDDALEGQPGAPSPRALLLPPLVVLAGLTAVAFVAWRGDLALPSGTLSLAEVYSRNLSVQDQSAPFIPYAQLRPLMGTFTLVLSLGSLGLVIAVWRRLPAVGLGVLLGVMVASLPLTTEGLALFARARSVAPIADFLRQNAGPYDVILHEGAIENSGSLVLTLGRPVKIVDGRASNLAFGATFPEARDTFWDADRLRKAWGGPHRVFLVSLRKPERSLVRELPRESVHLLGVSGGRWLYSNRPGGAQP